VHVHRERPLNVHRRARWERGRAVGRAGDRRASGSA
jgi:hypothetical protein